MKDKRSLHNRQSDKQRCPEDNTAHIEPDRDFQRVDDPEAESQSNKGFGSSSWRDVIKSAGIDRQAAVAFLQAAQRNGTTFLHELAISDQALQEKLYRSMADHLGVPFLANFEPDELVLNDEDVLTAVGLPHGPKIVFLATADASNDVLISPAHFDLSDMRGYLSRYPSIASRIKIVSPRTLRKALLHRAEPILARRANSHLFENHPGFSARIVANAAKGFGLGSAAAIMLIGLFIYPSTILALLHCVFSFCFLSCVALRIQAALGGQPPALAGKQTITDSKLPYYSVLIALYKEAEVVPDLLAGLQRIDWPASKLEIKLILEQDDHETLPAINRFSLPPNMEILTVPNMGPRTKPKALTYALPTISGEFVVVYDAEDLPHPEQLREAWAKFETSGPELACLQAPLQIRNRTTNMITRLFAFEYAALFRGLLPALARKRLFFPLGGTSNHFRVSALRDVCEWDPYNVTEDADLAVRLQRFGYGLDVIANPTLEDAPDTLPIWIRQRTRWFKGWMQTLLVHGRNYPETFRNLNFASFAVCQILLIGVIISSMSYIVILYILFSIAIKLFNFGSISKFDQLLLIVDSLNVLGGFSAFLYLGWKVLTSSERKGFWKIVLSMPVYWLMLSISSWRAAWQLYRQPFLWEKTPHRRHHKT